MELDDLFQEMYDTFNRLFPEVATRMGDHRYDDRLGDPSPAGQTAFEEAARGFLERISAFPRRRIPHRHRTSYEVSRLWLEEQVEGLPFRYYLLQLVDPIGGFQISLPNLFADMPLERPEGYRVCLERLARVAGYIDKVIEGTREAIHEGVLQPRPIVEKVLAQLEAQVALRAEKHPFFKPFERFPAGMAVEIRELTRALAIRIIGDEIIPALARFRDHLRDEYLPRAREEVGVRAVPGGEELYAWLVRHYTTRELGPERVHEMGLKEVERIRAEMEAVKSSAGFGGSLEQFFGQLRQDGRFLFEKPEDLLRGYRDIAKRADAELPRFFGKLPRIPYGVLPIPDFAAPAFPAAYYQPPPADGTRPGIFYVNTHDLQSRPSYEMEALALHEAVPGHHLQLALQLELQGLPPFRTRWLTFTAFVEGWGLYAERLGKEMGFYQDPYAEFGRLSYEVWRACRLVVDTGIHHFGWSRSRAVDYLLGNSGLARSTAEREVDRYIVWPAQALAYKVGEQKILGLRRRVEEALGEDFHLRAFHDRVLEEGSLPLEILEKKVIAWLRERKRELREKSAADPGAPSAGARPEGAAQGSPEHVVEESPQEAVEERPAG